MGQKINPFGFRLTNSKQWRSRWFARDSKQYRKNILEDHRIRRYLMDKLALAGIVEAQIERSINKMKITLKVSRPGVVIGRGGSGLELLKKDLVKMVSLTEPEKNLELDVEEVKEPELSAQLIAVRVVQQLEKRMPYRRVANKTIERAMDAGAQGIKIALSGRVGGAEISRTETFKKGAVPLQTLRAEIDYAQIPAITRFGYVGVKVWVYKGEKEE
ncbi:30S ribosomal protein S3 [Microgenomates group bacterium RBG_19FT_COMBO_39_10]|nr:ribosomal protein S3 [uncultured bacterium]OGV89209.1 MAG: 30S ribosomal protein S3 [Microgenomates group bacterium RBG_19FT_COMBO_39_10]